METIKMIPAKVKDSGLSVFVHEGRKSTMPANRGKLVVSKQPNSNSVFCIEPSNLIYG